MHGLGWHASAEPGARPLPRNPRQVVLDTLGDDEPETSCRLNK
jgi:hypothetical protein